MNLFDLIYILEQNEIHMARLLVLLKLFGGRWGKKPINGLTKLVKLDFLLRYPNYLDKSLKAIDIKTNKIKIKDYEKRTVESKMVRFRYGPWDPRYRHFINLLVSKELVDVNIKGRTIYVNLTDNGVVKANKLIDNPSFKEITLRAEILQQNFDRSGTYLKNFIYKTFPEITTLGLGEAIEP